MPHPNENRKPSLDEWRGLIPNLRKIGNEHKGACPACGTGDDRFWIKDDGTFGCRQGCTFEQIMRAIRWWNDTKPAGEVVTLTDSWIYQNTAGKFVAVKRKRGKGTRPWREPKGVEGPFLPLGVDALDKDKPIVICEGERCRDAILNNTTYQATTWISGVTNWGQTDWRSLAGCECVLWPDNDEIGKAEMRKLMGHLDEYGCSISVVTPLKDKPEKWDAADAKPGEAQTLLDDRAKLSKSQVERMVNAKVEPVPDPKPESPSVLKTITAAQITPKAVDWMIPGWLAAGNLTLLAGMAGMGKTTLALGVATAVSRGGTWGSGLPVKSGNVMMWCGEDDLEHTIVPNLIAAKADLNRIHFPAAVDTPSGEREFQPEIDMGPLTARIREIGNVKLLVIDPAMALVADAKDIYKATEIRRKLEPVQKLSKETGIAVLALTHFLKRHLASGSTVQDQVIGSQAWVAVSRMVWAVGKTEAGKALFRVKSNLGPTDGGFTYQISAQDLGMGKGVEGKVVSFGDDMVEGDADSAFDRPAEEKAAPKKGAAREWLEGWLDANPEGDTWERILGHAASEADIASRTLVRARAALRKDGLIERRTEGQGGDQKTIWRKVR